MVGINVIFLDLRGVWSGFHLERFANHVGIEYL